MAEYADFYEERFRRNLKTYAHLRQRLERKVGQILRDPYHNTEPLGAVDKGLNLRGCRSARIDRNFRIVFVVCEECRKIKQCQYCFCTAIANDCRIEREYSSHSVRISAPTR